MFSFEILHCVNQNLNAFDGQSVVERSTESANRTVALDAYDTSGSHEVEEVFFEFLVFGLHHKAYVHNRTVFGVGYSALEYAAVVDSAVEQLGLFEVDFFNGFNAAEFLVPFQGLVSGEDRL